MCIGKLILTGGTISIWFFFFIFVVLFRKDFFLFIFEWCMDAMRMRVREVWYDREKRNIQSIESIVSNKWNCFCVFFSSAIYLSYDVIVNWIEYFFSQFYFCLQNICNVIGMGSISFSVFHNICFWPFDSSLLENNK